MNQRRKVVVTGASSGIGRATAVRFASDGWDVCLNSRREESLRGLIRSLRPGDHLMCPGDYSSATVLEAMGKTLAERWQCVDVLVNCAGISQVAAVVDSPFEQWREPFDTMFDGGVRITRLCVPLM